MKFLVQFEVFESITAPTDIARLREATARAISRVMASGKVESAGALLPKRGGYFVLKEIDKEDDLINILGAEFLDNCRIQANPILSLEALGKWFRENPVRT
jgi:hypothetical protein